MPLGSLSGAGSLISGVGSLFGGGKSASAAKDAASIQANAAVQVAQMQQQMFQQVRGDLAPWQVFGGTAAGTLAAGGNLGSDWQDSSLFGPPTTWGMRTEFSPTMASLAQTPGYQFTLQQGDQATKNAYAAQGLGGSITGGQAGPSGPLGAGLTSYASGLASQTFNQQYQNWLAGQSFQTGLQQKAVAGLSGIASLGANAAAGQATNSGIFSNMIGNTQLSGAAASAAGVVGSANALNQGIAGAGSSLNNFALLNALGGQGQFSQSGINGNFGGGGGNTNPMTGMAS